MAIAAMVAILAISQVAQPPSAVVRVALRARVRVHPKKNGAAYATPLYRLKAYRLLANAFTSSSIFRASGDRGSCGDLSRNTCSSPIAGA